jgi:hypothetical protein
VIVVVVVHTLVVEVDNNLNESVKIALNRINPSYLAAVHNNAAVVHNKHFVVA